MSWGLVALRLRRSSGGTTKNSKPSIIAKCCRRRCHLSRVVLVVDDELLVREITASMVEDLGCEVITAASGTDALEKLSGDHRIEILITDINMPGMDGYELAERATRLRRQLRVIVLSGREADGGGFPLVRKPFLAQDLKRTMARHTGLC
jgi:two-component system cell cycle response regulator CpdR